jgi:hypothetical protein
MIFNIFCELKEIQFKCMYDDSLRIVDFKANNIVFCFIKPDFSQSQDLKQVVSEYRKSLAKVYNVIIY